MVKIIRLFSVLMVLTLLFSCGGDTDKSKTKTVNKAKKEIKTTKTKEKKLKKDTKKAEPTMNPDQIKKADELLANVSQKDIDKVDSKKLFRINCATCHGFKGNMKINGAKDLTKSSLPQNESVAQIYFGKGLMTPYKSILKENEIVALSKYVESLRQ